MAHEVGNEKIGENKTVSCTHRKEDCPVSFWLQKMYKRCRESHQ